MRVVWFILAIFVFVSEGKTLIAHPPQYLQSKTYSNANCQGDIVYMDIYIAGHCSNHTMACTNGVIRECTSGFDDVFHMPNWIGWKKSDNPWACQESDMFYKAIGFKTGCYQMEAYGATDMSYKYVCEPTDQSFHVYKSNDCSTDIVWETLYSTEMVMNSCRQDTKLGYWRIVHCEGHSTPEEETNTKKK